MKYRLKGHGIDMGVIKPLPPPLLHAQGGILLTLKLTNFDEAQCLTFKKMLPSDKGDVILKHNIKYVLMLHFASLPYFQEYFMPVKSPEMFITVYWI